MNSHNIKSFYPSPSSQPGVAYESVTLKKECKIFFVVLCLPCISLGWYCQENVFKVGGFGKNIYMWRGWVNLPPEALLWRTMVLWQGRIHNIKYILSFGLREGHLRFIVYSHLRMNLPVVSIIYSCHIMSSHVLPPRKTLISLVKKDLFIKTMSACQCYILTPGVNYCLICDNQQWYLPWKSICYKAASVTKHKLSKKDVSNFFPCIFPEKMLNQNSAKR